MTRHAFKLGATFGALAISLFGAGCGRHPSITFVEVPPAGPGGSAVVGTIRGRVTGNHKARHLLLYSYADGIWWVQPFASAPLTDIAGDGSWNAQIHLGSQYAAILIKDGNLPPKLVETLPAVEKNIEAVAMVKASGTVEQKSEAFTDRAPLRFSGLDWKVRTIPGDYGTKTNEYSFDNVSVDSTGALHLKLTKGVHGWVCSELQSVRSFGYGEYQFKVSDVQHLEPAVMFSTFTFFQDPRETDHRELVIRMTRRGVESNTNAEFIVQPAFVPTNFYHFNVPSGPLDLNLTWKPDKAIFSTSRTNKPEMKPFSSWVFKTGVPRSEGTHLYINLCNYGYAPVAPTHEAEITVKSFRFYP